MKRANDKTPEEPAARELADRTQFRLSPEAWDELVAIMDREARPNPKLAQGLLASLGHLGRPADGARSE